MIPLALLAACGDSEKESEVEKITFENTKDKLSYAFGVENARSIFQGNSKFESLDKELLIKGFDANLSDAEPAECQITLQRFLGMNGQDFDTTYLKDGSECIGRMTGYIFYTQLNQMQSMDEINLDLVKKGFSHGLYDRDTVNMTALERTEAIETFYKTLQEKAMAEKQKQDAANIEAGPAFWEKVKGTAGVKQIGSTGIYMETIENGSGGSPDQQSDVVAHYTLTNALGDTIESSLSVGQPLRMNLQGLIAGWKESFPSMKKGGKYRIFVPSEKAYNAGPLCFYIELLDFGPAGTMAPPPQQMPY